MKNLILIFSIILFANQLSAESVSSIMRSVNSEVDNQSDIPLEWTKTDIQLVNFNEAIQLHLLNVVSVLKARNVEHLSKKQSSERSNLLDVLQQYALNGIFPINTFVDYQTPVFIDKSNTHCAVGFLMEQSGFESLAREINIQQNLAYVKNIRVNGVSEWAKNHGFTIDELAWIQPGYPPATTITPLLGGMDGTVYSMVEYQSNIYAAGNFVHADGIEVNNIAVYIAGFAGYLWTDVQGGAFGEVRKLIVFENDLIAAGNITGFGSEVVTAANGIIRLHEGQWENMGDGLDGIVYDLCIWGDQLIAVGDFDIIGSDTNGKNIALWNGSSWDDIGLTTDGPVYTVFAGNTSLTFGGAFTSLGNHSARNIATWNGTTISSLGEGLKTPVYDIIQWNENLIAAGNILDSNVVQGILRFDAETWSPISGISEISSMDSTANFKSLLLINNELIVGGDFPWYPGVGIVGYGLSKWPTYQTNPVPLAWLDSTVYVCEDLGGLHIGGAFTNANGPALNGIARVDEITNIKLQKPSNKLSLSAYPTPSNGIIKLVNTNDANSVEIYDITGKLIDNQIVTEGMIIQLPFSGVFILKTDLGDSVRIVNKN
jgi:hypothetical protein